MLSTKSFYGRILKYKTKPNSATKTELHNALIHHKKTRQPLQPIEDIINERISSGNTKEVLVKWKDKSPDSWIDIDKEAHLKEYLFYNEANPYSCTLIRQKLWDTLPCLEYTEISALKQAIFDQLGGGSTPPGYRGKRRRNTVSIPFPKLIWDATFGQNTWPKVDSQDDGNKAFHTSVSSLNCILGQGWHSRSLSTSTCNQVDPNYPLYITWEYKSRKQYNHQQCSR